MAPQSPATTKPSWVWGFIAGLGALLSMSSTSWLLGILALLIAISGVLGNRRLATSGVLLGYGVPWLALTLWGHTRGAQADNVAAGLAFGLAVLVAGVALGARVGFERTDRLCRTVVWAGTRRQTRWRHLGR